MLGRQNDGRKRIDAKSLNTYMYIYIKKENLITLRQHNEQKSNVIK